MTEYFRQDYEALSTGALAGQDSFTDYGGSVAEVVDTRGIGKKCLLLNGFGGCRRTVSADGRTIAVRWAHYIEPDSGAESDYPAFCAVRLFDGNKFIECRIGSDYLGAGVARFVATPSFMVGKWLDCRWFIDLATERSWLWIDNVPLITDEPLHPPFCATAVDGVALINSEGVIYDSGGFEAFTLGDIGGQFGWRTIAPHGSGQVVAAPVAAGSRALSLSAFTSNRFNFYPPDQARDFEVECAFRVNFTDGYAALTLYDDNDYAFTSVTFKPNTVQWQLGSNTAVTNGVWYTLKIVLHRQTNCCDYYLDDVLQYEGVGEVVTGMGAIKFAASSDLDYGETLDIDDLIIRERLP